MSTGMPHIFNKMDISSTGTESTIEDSPVNNTELHNIIREQDNTIRKLKQEIETLNYNYKDTDLPPTVKADRNGNVLYTRCPFNTHNNEQLYSDGKGTITLTPMQSKFINSLYVLCPLTTKHPKNAPVFDEHGKIVKGEELFKDSPNKSRKRKSSSPKKTPSPRKTQKKSPSPRKSPKKTPSPRKSPKNHQKRQKH